MINGPFESVPGVPAPPAVLLLIKPTTSTRFAGAVGTGGVPSQSDGLKSKVKVIEVALSVHPHNKVKSKLK
jgi:hypothetical protein